MTHSLDFVSLNEPRLGAKWANAFSIGWPSYKQFFLRHGEANRPTYRQVEKAINRYMPEFIQTYEEMVELAGDSDFAARFLAQYCPPPFFAACSQLMLVEGEPMLVRNYDFPTSMCDGLVMKTHWNQQSVIGMIDCMSGVTDGINENGLAVSVAFGGRDAVGEGFSITLIERYVLETCTNVAEACAAFCRIPVFASYNIAVLDAFGNYATLFLSPDHEPLVTADLISTNHQKYDRWERYAEVMETDLRYEHLSQLLVNCGADHHTVIRSFLEKPLYRGGYKKGYGTLFTSAYFPLRKQAHYYWPDESWVFGFDHFSELHYKATYSDKDLSAFVRAKPTVPFHVPGSSIK